MPSRDLEVFLRQLATLSQAGVPMADGLRVLAPQLPPKLSRLATDIAAGLADGQPLAAALASHPQLDRATLALVSVGEQTGRLADLLTHAANLLEQRRAILSTLAAKLAYPVILCHLVFIIPSLGKWLFPQTQFVPAWFILGLLPLYALIASAVIFNRARRRSAELDTLTMNLPLIGTLLKISATVNFSRCLQACLLAGVNLREALPDCAIATNSPAAAADLAAAQRAIADGDTLTGALAPCRFLPAVTRSLIATGEQSGSLVEMLDRSTQLLTEEFSRKTALLTTILSAAVFTAAALFVGWLIVSGFASYYGQINELMNY